MDEKQNIGKKDSKITKIFHGTKGKIKDKLDIDRIKETTDELSDKLKNKKDEIADKIDTDKLKKNAEKLVHKVHDAKDKLAKNIDDEMINKAKDKFKKSATTTVDGHLNHGLVGKVWQHKYGKIAIAIAVIGIVIILNIFLGGDETTPIAPTTSSEPVTNTASNYAENKDVDDINEKENYVAGARVEHVDDLKHKKTEADAKRKALQLKKYKEPTAPPSSFPEKEKFTMEDCKALNLNGDALSLCLSYDWGRLEDKLRELVCVGYSESVCYKPKDKEDSVRFFKAYPKAFEIAMNTVNSSTNHYHAAELIEAFNNFGIENGLIQGGSGNTSVMEKAGTSSVTYNREKLEFLGNFPVYLHNDSKKVIKQCNSMRGVPLTQNMMSSHLKAGNIRAIRNSEIAIITTDDKLNLINLKSGTKENGNWGLLFCEKREDLLVDKNYKDLHKVTFRESQNYCLEQGKFLLSEDEAKGRVLMIAKEINKKRLKLKNIRNSSYIPRIYIAYANSQYDYGYVSCTPHNPQMQHVTVKPINGTKRGQYKEYQVDRKIVGYGLTDYLGLDKYPPEYNVTMTNRGKVSGSKDDYFYVFGACSCKGKEIKDKK
ncbi:hypothetical protein [uncultured Desulfobacter sp.]|uniref:hypothetical protein n=1 Tax=uncultured Desulfobacter sp. TaxID=240139 RepID=UPI0029C65496|nr:hypothetical protein [uncultured Desulfobacter sp.]